MEWNIFEKLKFSQLVEKLLADYVNQLFVVVFNTARQMFGVASDEYIHAKPSILLRTCFIILPSTPRVFQVVSVPKISLQIPVGILLFPLTYETSRQYSPS
jgi:hypothetical protein